MNWNMKKINTFRRSAGLAVVVVMAVHLLSGSGFFCANENVRPFVAPGNETSPSGVTASDSGQGTTSESVGDYAPSQGGGHKCSCKKCPAVPRTAITSNPTQRFNELQHQAKSVCCEPFVSQSRDYRFATGGAPPLTELVSRAPFYSTIPLELTSVLLI